MNASTDFIDANLDGDRAGRVAVIEAEADRELTYADISQAVCRTGHALRRLGVRPEERVAILLPDSAAFVAAFFGAIRIGAVAVPMNTLLTRDHCHYLLSDSRARVLVVHEVFVDRIAAARDQLPHLHHIVVVTDSSRRSVHAKADGATAYLRFDDLLAQEDHTLPPEDMHRNDAALWLCSSGTTGSPKVVVHRQHSMRSCAEAFGLGVLGLNAEDRVFSVAKLSFAYGLGNGLYMPFFVGGSTVLLPSKPTTDMIFGVMRRFRPTVLFAVPTAYAAMLTALDAGAEQASGRLRLCSSAGEPLSASLYERWCAHTGVEILDGIGATETLHTFIANRPGRARPGSSGELVAGYEARVVDASDEDVPVGEVGDLLVRGESICMGYWHNQPESHRRFDGGWFRTGDRYVRDGDEYFWYQGRSDDMLKCGGLWVSPTEVESALSTHPSVLESAVVGREDKERLVKPMAFIVLKPGHVASPELSETIKAHVKGQLSVYKCPRWLEFVNELPRSITGKVQRARLRATLAAGPPA